MSEFVHDSFIKIRSGLRSQATERSSSILLTIDCALVYMISSDLDLGCTSLPCVCLDDPESPLLSTKKVPFHHWVLPS